MNTILGLLGFAARTDAGASKEALMIIRVLNENVRVDLVIVIQYGFDGMICQAFTAFVVAGPPLENRLTCPALPADG